MIAKPTELCYQLLPPEWEAALAHLATKGARKYAPHDWEETPGRYMDRIDSLRRHLKNWQMGEDIDSETQAHNLVAVAYNALMVYVWASRDIGDDNRPSYSKTELDRLANDVRETTASLDPGIEVDKTLELYDGPWYDVTQSVMSGAKNLDTIVESKDQVRINCNKYLTVLKGDIVEVIKRVHNGNIKAVNSDGVILNFSAGEYEELTREEVNGI